MFRNEFKLEVLPSSQYIDKGVIMSKIKEQMERDHEIEMEEYYSFMEWVCDQEVSVSDTKEVEEDLYESSTTRTSIVPKNTLNAVNNIDYNPNRSIR